MHPNILIIDLGSQHTLQILRCLMQLGHLCVVVDYKEADRWLQEHSVKCVIGSGGMKSVYEEGAPRVPFQRILDAHLPYLGICFGMQSLANEFRGRVDKGQPEYARAMIALGESSIFSGLDPEQEVWMSHGDSVVDPGECFKIIARSRSTGLIAAIANESWKWFGVQFHPEVSHTPNGRRILSNFVECIAGCEAQHKRVLLDEVIQTKLREDTGDSRAIIGFSGGVDSTTLAKLASPVFEDRLLAITIDGGHLRENEIAEIKLHAEYAGVRLKIIDASEEMVAAISKTTDSEEKRAIFRKIYARIFEEEARAFGGDDCVIAQATLAPDRIESGHTGGTKIKTHHNVGLDFGGLRQLHPLGELYKDQVRALAHGSRLPESVFNRPPFPGPGNFLRVVNIPVSREALSVVQWAEARVRRILARHEEYQDIAQLVVAVIGKAKGVKGDGAIYGYMIAVRGVKTQDFMTAEGVEFSPEMQRIIKTKLGEHPLITQVGFFPMDKPPGTTEFE